MPRGFKCRRVCSVPKNRMFTPQRPCGEAVTLTVEELETIRLCDLEGLEQDEAAVSMNVSRGTFQRILYGARRKTADALCNGKEVEIGGGNYEVAKHPCECRRRCRQCSFEKSVKEGEQQNGRS